MTTASRVRLRLVGDDRLVASVRGGDSAAFEAMYDRHSAELLSFCVYMLGSRHDAEDALQATFASAYRALRSDRRTVALRPWLFTIARNHCLSILRRRRPWVELDGEQAPNGDPLRELELREEVRLMIEGLRALPESQRASLVLAELHGFTQSEIGSVLGVQAEQVKAFICQARSNLISERTAREADCREIREELATARGAALLRSRLRRHLRACDNCRVYADGVASQRRHLGALLPLAPSLILKYRALEGALGIGVADPTGYAGGAAVGGTVAAGAVEVAGGGFKALALKIAAGVACLGAGAGAGASVLISPATPAGPSRASAAATAAHRGSVPASVGTEAALAEGRWPTTATSRTRLVGSRGEGAPGAGVTPAADSPKNEAERRQRSEEREKRGDEQQRRAEEEHRRQLEERAPGAAAQSQAERRKAQQERRASNQPRVPKTEEQRQRAHEERAGVGASRPPRTKEERQQSRREKKPERVSRPPKSEVERQRLHEERLGRREEKKAETPGS
jgi:RNA polymerase sigma factor (sigma-70 family)